jgi:hypothetical protein
MLSGSWARYAPLAGLLFIALVIVSIIVEGETPATDDPTGQVVLDWAKNDDDYKISAALGALATVPFLWFLGSLRSTLRAAEGGTGRLSAIAFAGGIILAAGAGVDASLQWATAESVGDVPPNVTQTLSVLYSEFFLIFGIGIGTLFLASGLAMLRTRALPVWLGWVTLLLGILAITPIGFVAFPLGALWVIVTSIILFQQGSPAAPAPGQTALPTTQ